MTQRAKTPETSNHPPQTGSKPFLPFGRWTASAVLAMLVLAIILTAGLQSTPTAEAQVVVNNAATGLPGIQNAADPTDLLLTVRPGITLTTVTSGIMDDDGITPANHS